MITCSKRLSAAALGCAAMAVAVGAPTAGASFKPPYNTKCAGSSISGVGSTFQNTLQNVFAANWGAASCTGTAPTITYNPAGVPNGSGAGLAAMGATDAPGAARSATFNFGGTDDAPTTLQITNANEGPTVSSAAGNDGDDGALRTIPVAAGAIAFIVNYPDHCILPTGFTYTKTSGPAGNTRLALSRGRMERMWRGGTGNVLWSDVVTGIDDDNSVDGNPATNQCANIPIKRVVRNDTSGSSLTMKRWLDVVRPATGYLALANTAWPNDAAPTAIVHPDSTGGGSLAAKVNATDGSIGYVDLATARGAGFDLAPNTGDTTYWLPVQDMNSNFQDPQYYHYAQLTPAVYQQAYGKAIQKGANCRTTTFSGIPDANGNGKDEADTFASWQNVNGVASGSNGGYPICLLTYDLAWDDAWDALGGPLPPVASRPVEAAQRTIRDYLVYATSLSGATQANLNDYAQLPEDIRSQIASPAAAALSFNK